MNNNYCIESSVWQEDSIEAAPINPFHAVRYTVERVCSWTVVLHPTVGYSKHGSVREVCSFPLMQRCQLPRKRCHRVKSTNLTPRLTPSWANLYRLLLLVRDSYSCTSL